jgi:hypothetical protein
MAGLLDGFSAFVKTPEGQGLLSAAFGGLAGARRGAPLNSIGMAGMAGLQGYSGAQDREKQLAEAAQMQKYRDMQQQQMQMQIEAAKRDQGKTAAIDALIPQFYKPGQPAQPGAAAIPGLTPIDSMLPKDMQIGTPERPAIPAVAPSFDMQGFAQGVMGVDPLKGFGYLQAMAKDDAPVKLAPGEQMFSGKASGYKPLLSVPAKEAAKPSAIQEYEYAKEQGYPGSFEQFQTSQKRAGATNITNKVETKMGESIAGQVGPMARDTYNAANGAVQQLDAASRIVKAIDSGSVFAGPGAGIRLKAAQLGQILGVSGGNDSETIARSRDVIRGLAEMTLQGRKQMTGQGAITESEGKLAEKANSGDITDLTASEIKQLARASARAAKFTYAQHEQMLGNMRSDPGTSKLADFYKVRPMPAFDLGEQTAPGQGGGVVDFGSLK